MTKDAIKNQTINKMRINIQKFLFFLKQQNNGLLTRPSSLTLLNFYYSVYLIEFQSFYKLNKYLSVKNIYYVFLTTSNFFYSKKLQQQYNLYLYYLPYFLQFFSWTQLYSIIQFKNFSLTNFQFNDYIYNQNLYFFKFYWTFKLTNFFLVFNKTKNLITYSQNQALAQKKFNILDFQEILQNTVFLLTFYLTSNWQFFLYNLTNYFSIFLLTIFFTLKQIWQQLKISISINFIKLNIKKKLIFGYRKQKKLPTKKTNVI